MIFTDAFVLSMFLCQQHSLHDFTDAFVLLSMFLQWKERQHIYMCNYIYFLASDAITDLDGDVGILILPCIFHAAGLASLVTLDQCWDGQWMEDIDI